MAESFLQNLPPRYLNPSMSGVASRRPYVLLRRTEERCLVLNDIMFSVNDAPGTALTEEQAQFMEEKLFHMKRAVVDVVAYIAHRPEQLEMIQRLILVLLNIKFLSRFLEGWKKESKPQSEPASKSG